MTIRTAMKTASASPLIITQSIIINVATGVDFIIDIRGVINAFIAEN